MRGSKRLAECFTVNNFWRYSYFFLGKISRKNYFFGNKSKYFWADSKNVTDSYFTNQELPFDVSLTSVVSVSDKTLFSFEPFFKQKSLMYWLVVCCVNIII